VSLNGFLHLPRASLVRGQDKDLVNSRVTADGSDDKYGEAGVKDATDAEE